MSSSRHALKSVWGFVAESAGFLEDTASNARTGMRGVGHHATGFEKTAKVRASLSVMEAAAEMRKDHADAIKANPDIEDALKALEVL